MGTLLEVLAVMTGLDSSTASPEPTSKSKDGTERATLIGSPLSEKSRFCGG